jgi:CHAT domain-containing protein
VRGEGLIGMTRGFMYAGAPRVVASLWSVPDAATATLMERFYRGMFKEGLTAAAALRAAQTAVRRNPETSAPFYWAAFVLQGEYR